MMKNENAVSECVLPQGKRDGRERSSLRRTCFCSDCGDEIVRGSRFYRFPIGSVCERCAERLDTDSLIGLFGFGGLDALLEATGAERAVAP